MSSKQSKEIRRHDTQGQMNTMPEELGLEELGNTEVSPKFLQSNFDSGKNAA